MDSISRQLTNGLTVSIDWIAFTSTQMSGFPEMAEFMGFSESDFSPMPKGAYGYRQMHRLQGASVSILSDGNEGMGVHVVISGAAITNVLRRFQASISGCSPFGDPEGVMEVSDVGNDVLIEFLQRVRGIGWITRLDLAVDDRGARYFTLDDLSGFLDRQEVLSRFRSYRDVREATFANDVTGRTIYFGSRSSEVMMRVYDKRLEQMRKAAGGAEDPGADEPWVRWEIELKNERADVAADWLIRRKAVGEVVMEILNNYVRLIVNDDCNRSRCSSHPLWERFVSVVGKLRLFVAAAQKTIKDKRRWLIRQCLPTLAGVMIADGGGFDIITDHFDNAVLRMGCELRGLVSAENPGWESQFLLC